MKQINQLPETTTAGNNDFLAIQSSGITKKITKQNFLQGLSIGSSGDSWKYIQLLHTVANGGSAGTTASGWNNRPINQIANDDTGLVTLSSDQFVLPAGSYIINATANFYRPYECQLRLQNVTDSVTLIAGLGAYVGVLDTAISATLSGKFTIAANKTLAIQYRVNNPGVANIGLGISPSFGINNVFLTADIFKV